MEQFSLAHEVSLRVENKILWEGGRKEGRREGGREGVRKEGWREGGRWDFYKLHSGKRSDQMDLTSSRLNCT